MLTGCRLLVIALLGALCLVMVVLVLPFIAVAFGIH
jgi:hypothetical protein